MDEGDSSSESSLPNHSLTEGKMIVSQPSEYDSCLASFPIVKIDNIPQPSSFHINEDQIIDHSIDPELTAYPNTCNNPTISTTMLDHKNDPSFFRKLFCCKDIH